MQALRRHFPTTVRSRHFSPGSPRSDQTRLFSLVSHPQSSQSTRSDFLNAIPAPSTRDALEPPKKPLRRGPRQAMTARESSAFDEMFALIFNAVSAQEKGDASTLEPPIGIGRGGVDDLIGKLRKFPRKLKPARQIDEVLDRKKEEIDLCDSDYELLHWASREVFDESRRYEEHARKAISQAASSSSTELPMLQPPTYPHLLAHLMHTFREKYGDPHLALTMFDHARSLSIASYVFGCSTPAYNELIETRWKCFRDLKGVYDALEEMRVNGVKFDARTRKVVEMVRREVGEQNLSVEDPGLDSGEIWNLLTRIESIVASKAPGKPGMPASYEPKQWDVWKTTPLEDTEGDSWGFNQWDKDHKPRRRRIGRREAHTG